MEERRPVSQRSLVVPGQVLEMLWRLIMCISCQLTESRLSEQVAMGSQERCSSSQTYEALSNVPDA